MSQLYVDAATKEDAERITAQNLTRIRTVAQQTLRDNGCGDAVTVEMKNMYFNTRYYDDFTMPAGYYDALRVRIGSAEGQNWWCVMYPSLCVGTASRHSAKESLSEGEYQVISSDEPEFRFKLVEYYERLRSFFR